MAHDRTTAREEATVYTPESELRRPAALLRSMGRDIRASRELAWRLFVRNTSTMYRQTVLGYLWAFLPPLLTSLTWIFLNRQRVFDMAETPVPYPVYVFVGTTLWQVFVDGIYAPVRIVKESSNMLAKVKFPREALLFAAFGEVVFNLCVRLVLLAGVFWYFDAPVTWAALGAIPGVFLLIALAMMIGILLTPLGLLWGDVARAIPIITQPWFYITPIVYAVPTTGAAALLAKVNPAAPPLILSRELLTTGEVVLLGPTAVIACATALLLGFGWLMYRVAMPHLIERIAA